MHHEQAEKGIILKEELYELLEAPSGGQVIQKYNFFHTHSPPTFIQT